jgi:hypothetical protein
MLVLVVFVLFCVGISLQNSNKAAASAPGAAALPPANPAQEAKCHKVLDYGFRIGALKSYKGTGDGYGTVVVGPSFYSASFENKQALDATVRCVLSEGRNSYAGLKYVEYLDPYTNKEIAKWSNVTGFSVD